jgi:YfiH family protein
VDLKQVHGSDIVDPKNALEAEIAADGFFISDTLSIKKPLGLIIKTADCLPVIIRSNNSVAIVHAGWRGLAAGIVEKAAKLVDDGKGELKVAIGPCICKDCFEVDSDVYSVLGGEQRGAKYYPDLAEIAAKKVLEVIPNTEVVKSNICTKCSVNFNSYRRDQKIAGRNIALLVVNNKERLCQKQYI